MEAAAKFSYKQQGVGLMTNAFNAAHAWETHRRDYADVSDLWLAPWLNLEECVPDGSNPHIRPIAFPLLLLLH